jgi:hypothetical protein
MKQPNEELIRQAGEHPFFLYLASGLVLHVVMGVVAQCAGPRLYRFFERRGKV